jgi:hypothetical protein
MGLLDEAIREHLELKRRRGADPVEVAREQRDALDPVSAPAPPAEALDDAAEQTVVEDLPTEEHALDGAAIDPDQADAGADGPAGHGPPAAEGSARLLEPEETAELDMSTVLEDEPAAQGRSAVGRDDAHGAAPHAGRAQLRSADGTAGSESL